MGSDLQILQMVDTLQVLEFEEVAGSSPRAVDVLGVGGMLSASSVYVNGLSVPNFEILSDYYLRVTLDPPFSDTPVSGMDISVASNKLTSTRAVTLVFGFPMTSMSRVSGIMKLVQQVLKCLLSDGGSNRYSPSDGGGLVQMIGGSMTEDASARVGSAVANAISTTSDLVISAQANESLPDDEKLLALSLSGVSFNSSDQSVYASIRLVTYAGTIITIPLPL